LRILNPEHPGAATRIRRVTPHRSALMLSAGMSRGSHGSDRQFDLSELPDAERRGREILHVLWIVVGFGLSKLRIQQFVRGALLL